jgi:dipeptidyl aminopeptidase/acylaminoacyl peptidase
LKALRSLLAAAGLVLALPAVASPPSVRDFFHEPKFSSPALSPDGKSLAAIYQKKDGDPHVVVIDLATDKSRVVSPRWDQPVAAPRWITPDWLVYQVAPRRGTEWPVPSIIAVTRDGSEARYLSTGRHPPDDDYSDPASWEPEGNGDKQLHLGDPELVGTVPGRSPAVLLAGIDLKEETRLLADITDTEEDQKKAIEQLQATVRSHLYKIDLESGQVTVVDTAPAANADGWIVARNQKARAVSTIDNKHVCHVYLRADASSPWHEIASYGVADPPVIPAAFSQDGEHLYLFSGQGRHTQALFSMNVGNGQMGKPLLASDKADINQAIFDRDGELLAAGSDADGSLTHYFDAAHARVVHAIRKALPDYAVDVHFDNDARLALVEAWNSRNPGDYYLYHPVSGKLERLFAINSALAPEQMSTTRPITYKARDGLEIHGFLTRPEHAHQRGMVVLVHGGPFEIHDTWGFNPEVQFLASRGFAVLQVNYRGSGGYGTQFVKEGWKQWGQGILNDVADGTRWAIDQHYARSGHVCIYGGSFGGYAAFMGLIRYPDLYACGASFAGVTDLPLLIQEDSARNIPGLDIWLRHAIGDTKKDMAALEADSPVNLVRKIRAPLFVAHGTADNTVPIEQTQRLVEALRKAGVGADILYLNGQPHGFSDGDKRIVFYKALEAFLENHIGESQ